jgi:hypothetical protein
MDAYAGMVQELSTTVKSPTGTCPGKLKHMVEKKDWFISGQKPEATIKIVLGLD